MAALTLVALACAPAAHAALGHAAESVQADRLHMSAKLASTSAATYTVHSLTLANNGVVKEFAGADGVVFAVAWRGPGRPDLRQLLGDHFATLQADTAVAGGRRLRMPVAVNHSDFVVHSSGHPGAFWGQAYLPASIPAGVTAADLH
ncbi:MAG: DUF2844 domain-containing protein [Caulobacteraceae bacterium]